MNGDIVMHWLLYVVAVLLLLNILIYYYVVSHIGRIKYLHVGQHIFV